MPDIPKEPCIYQFEYKGTEYTAKLIDGSWKLPRLIISEEEQFDKYIQDILTNV